MNNSANSVNTDKTDNSDNTFNTYIYTSVQDLLKKIKDLQEIVDNSAPIFSQDIPAGYTPSRWQLALQSFQERLPQLKERKFLRSSSASSDVSRKEDSGVEIEFGPEWDLKCAKKELEDLLNK